MTQYIPVSNEAAGLALSGKLYELVRPPSVRNPGDSQFLGGVLQDKNGNWFVEIKDRDAILPIHAGLSDAEIASIVDEIEKLEDLLP